MPVGDRDRPYDVTRSDLADLVSLVEPEDVEGVLHPDSENATAIRGPIPRIFASRFSQSGHETPLKSDAS